jgi:hypothetical protein
MFHVEPWTSLGDQRLAHPCSTWNMGLGWTQGTVSRRTHQAPEFLNSRPTDDGIPLLQEKCQIRANRRSTWNVEPIRGEND